MNLPPLPDKRASIVDPDGSPSADWYRTLSLLVAYIRALERRVKELEDAP